MNIEALSIGESNKIKYLVTDCDGVLTDGKYYYNRDERHSITFSALDSLAVVLVKRSDLEFFVVSSTSIPEIVNRRCIDWGVRFHWAPPWHKLDLIEDLVDLDSTAYIGDSLDDLVVFDKVKLALTPANSIDVVKSNANYILNRNSGEGCLLDAILALRYRNETWQNYRVVP